MDIQTKLENYLNDDDLDDFLPEEDTDMMERMVDFIMNLDTESLSEDQVEELTEIIDYLADDNMEEAFSGAAKKVKIRPQDKRLRRMQYRKKRAQIKLTAKKFRRTTKYKQWKRMKKRKAGSGKTARGKRIRKFL